MKRVAIKRKLPQWQDKSKQWSGPEIGPRRPVLRVVQPEVGRRAPIPKPKPLRDKAYQRWVASLACAHCGRIGPSQAAHADMGKGMGTKAGDETLHPLCATKPGRPGCHDLIGSMGMFTKDQRRQLEADYGARTRDRARREGVYPEGWP